MREKQKRSEFIETVSQEDANAVIDSKLRKVFDGRIVRKDLTKKIKEGANVPVYVLEFFYSHYCSSDDPDVIETGVANVKRILFENTVLIQKIMRQSLDSSRSSVWQLRLEVFWIRKACLTTDIVPVTAQIALRIMDIAMVDGIMVMTTRMVASLAETKAEVDYNFLMKHRLRNKHTIFF